MTPEEINTRVTYIAEISSDDAAAHVAEDKLYIDFVDFVAASGVEPLASLATRILMTKQIEFKRTCA